MNRLHSPKNNARRALLITTIALIITVITAQSAYRITRPISNSFPINQDYLYGEDNGTHKGIDFPAYRGTDVYAVASGRVVDLREDIADGTNPYAWGNFVLVQHTQRHWDRSSVQNAYVYSLYMHLKQNGVLVNEGDQVTAGSRIGLVDNTGNSTGDHLHLQIVLHPQSDRALYPNNTLDSENRTRNPELWLNPYPNTGTVVGKATNSNGAPVGGLRVYGLQKQAGWGYEWSETYIGSPINPDDILVENWATTDVNPGTYHITLSNGADMGLHTVRASQITYVGLYPIWLPDILGNWNGWNSTITVRNNNGSKQAQVNTSFFFTSGSIHSQRTDYVGPNGSLIFSPPNNFSGSAIVVASEDISVVVVNRKSSPVMAHSYHGIEPLGSRANSAAPRLFLPILYRHTTWGYFSKIYIQNISSGSAFITITFRNQDGSTRYTASYSIPISGRKIVDLQADYTWNNYYGTAIVDADLPIAVFVESFNSNINVDMDYNAISGITKKALLPYLMKNYNGWGSCFAVQNTASSSTTVTVTYYPFGTGYNPYNGDPIGGGSYNMAGYANLTVCQNNDNHLPQDFVGGTAAILTSTTQNIAAAANQDNVNWGGAGNQIMSYSSLPSGSNTIILPYMLRGYSSGGETWNSGITVQNVGSNTTNVTATFYDTNGNYLGSYTWTDVRAGFSKAVYLPSIGGLPNFIGSAVLTASQPILAVGNASCSSGCSGDTSLTYNGINR